MTKRKPYSATDKNLLAHSLEPTFRLLIATALDGGEMTYGEVKAKLEETAGFSTIFATRIGFVAGSLMHLIQDVVPDAPLINVLVVNQIDRQPSKGAGGFMARRFNEPRLAKDDAKVRHPNLWGKTFKRAAAEVYEYGPDEWAELYKTVFGQPLTKDRIEKQRDDRKRGTEKDGIQYGRGGEGEHHRALRLWTMNNPQAIRKAFARAETETESDLDSGDRIDVVYKCADRIVLLEVKSRISNLIDLKRGVYQCIKYHAVRAAMDVRDDPLIETYLVTETKLPGEIAALLRLHGIKHFQAPQVRK